jgi:ABC-2 type transport system permease protein
MARLVWQGLVMHVKTLSVSNWFLLMAVIQPVIFASVAFYMFRSGSRGETLLYAALGAALMGIWSSVLFGSGGAIQWQRWQGTLELAVAAPPPLAIVFLPVTLATSVVGAYSLLATLLWGRLFFGIHLELEHPFLFVLAVPATVFSLGCLGLLLASTFILYRHANALSNLLEYPVWFITGLLIPLSLLPGWVTPISWVLAPTWGVRAIRESAIGGDPLPEILLSIGLAAVYFALAWFFLNLFERLARERATLSLT